jgi:hypothetical protein
MYYMFKNNYKTEAFTLEEIKQIQESVNNELMNRETVEWDDSTMGGTHEENLVRIKKNNLGRLEINNLPLPFAIRTKAWRMGQEMYQLDRSYPKNISGITYVEYNPKYGVPVLNLHKDNGSCGLILDYQLESNVVWPFGVEDSLYELEDNSVLAMYPITHYHWRPEIKWSDGDFVKLVFFEFFTPDLEKEEDESRKKEVKKFIDSFSLGGKK